MPLRGPQKGVSRAVAKAVTEGWNSGWGAMPGGYHAVGEPSRAGGSNWRGCPSRQRGQGGVNPPPFKRKPWLRPCAGLASWRGPHGDAGGADEGFGVVLGVAFWVMITRE